MQIPFPVTTEQRRSPNVSSERLFNMYAEVSERGKSPVGLYRTQGTRRINGTPLSNGECRGAFGWQDVGYLVAGDKLFQFTPLQNGGFDIQERGTLLTSEGRVVFAADLDEVVLVDGANGYVYNTDSGVFSTINDVDFQGGTHVAHLNGFTITNRPTSGVWQISSPQVALDWDALDIAVSESNGDNIQALDAFEERVWILGSHTTEVWVPTTSDFPFDRQVSLDVGCGAPYSLARGDNSLLWVDWEGFVRRTAGFRAVIISNQALNDAIENMARFDDAYGFTFSADGHAFYQLTFPTGNQTWVYDFATGLWHERGYYDQPNQAAIRHHAACHMYAGKKNLVGDFRDGRVYEYTSQVQTDDQGVKMWEFITPPVVDAGDPTRPLRFFDLVLDGQTGVGNMQVPSPEVRMSYSDDGGVTWKDDQTRALDLGTGASARAARLKWTRLGRSEFKGRMFRFRGDDPVFSAFTSITSRAA